MTNNHPYSAHIRDHRIRNRVEKAKDLIVVDPATGEKTDYYEAAPKFSEKKKKARKALTEMQKFSKENGDFVIAFFEETKRIADNFPDLTQSDMARVLFIATYVGYVEGSDTYCYLKYDNGRYINKASLKKLLDVSPRAFGSFYNKLIDNEILCEYDEKLTINPTYFFRGDIKKVVHFTVNKVHTRVFRDTVRDLYKEFNGRTIKQLGVIYAVLPYIHFKYNIISHNPMEKVPEYVKPMVLGELAEVLGYKDANKLKQVLRSIRIDGQAAFLFVEDESDNRKRKVIVNHRLVFASNTEALEALEANSVLFNKID